MPRVVHFEINADDPERALRFYERVFGWDFTKWEGPMDYWLIKTGEEDEPGIDGGLMRRQDPNAAVIDTIDVPSVDVYVKKVQENGGEIVQPKTAVPGVGYVAYVKDTEGNPFGIMESDESAE
jgi:predicted enzyme related to lactoylglutathione lyase